MNKTQDIPAFQRNKFHTNYAKIPFFPRTKIHNLYFTFETRRDKRKKVNNSNQNKIKEKKYNYPNILDRNIYVYYINSLCDSPAIPNIIIISLSSTVHNKLRKHGALASF